MDPPDQLSSSFSAINTANKSNYGASGLKHTLHGTIYQLKLLILFLKRGLDREYDFYLATEMDVAEKFDDLVFRYMDKVNVRANYRFLQAKHKQDSSFKIQLKDLEAPTTASDTDFSLLKYFLSYRRLKASLSKNSPEFPNGIIEDCIICTNCDVHEVLMDKFNVLNNTDLMLEFKHPLQKIPRRLKFKSENIGQDTIRTLKMASDTFILAGKLADVISEGRKVGFRYPLFKTYHFPLTKYVIDTSNKRFHRQFLKGMNLKNDVQIFRKAFEEHIGTKMSWNDLYQFTFQFTTDFLNFKHCGAKYFPSDYPVSNQEIAEFFDKFTLAVNQPDETELGQLISLEIGDEGMFNLIDSDLVADHIQRVMLDWFKEKTGSFMTYDQGKTFFYETKAKVSKLVMNGPTLLYCSKLAHNDFYFKDFPEDLTNFFAQDICQLLIVTTKSDNNILSAVKVFRAIEDHQMYQKDDSYIFICANMLSPLQQKIRCALASPTSLLVVHWDKGNINTNLLDCICEPILKSSTKKVILITNDADPFASNPINNTGPLRRVLKDKCDFQNLTTGCQSKILKEYVCFHDKKVALADLFNFHEMNDLQKGAILNQDALTEILTKVQINLGVPFSGYEFVHVVIPRTLNYQFYLDQDCFAEIMHSTFAISNISAADFNKLFDAVYEEHPFVDNHSKRLIRLHETNPEENFARLCKENENNKMPVHWLIFRENNKFSWQKTHGNISGLRSHKLEDKEMLRPIVLQDFKKPISLHFESQIIIVAGEPGIGKSTALSHISEMSKAVTLDFLIISIDLIMHSLLLKKINFSDSDVMKFLIDVTNAQTSLAKNILEFKLTNNHNISIIFDRYDELSELDQQKVVQLVKFLKSKTPNLQIFILCRKYFQEELEDAFGQFAYTLEGFQAEEIEHFLLSYWTNGNLNIDKVRAHKFIKFMVTILLGSKTWVGIVGIALQTTMVAEIFLNDFQTFINSNNDASGTLCNFNIDELYQKFVDNKFNKHLTQFLKIDVSMNPGSSEALKKSYTKCHRSLAFESVFPGHSIFELFTNCLKFSHQELGQLGIISNLKNRDADFLHHTYAEFFISDALFDTLQRGEGHKKYKSVRSFLLRQIFLNRNSLIRKLIHCRVEKSVDCNLINRWQAIIDSELLSNVQHFRGINFVFSDSEGCETKTIPCGGSGNELETCIERFTHPSILKWKGGLYTFFGGIHLFDELCQSFLSESNIEHLKPAMQAIMSHAYKSYFDKLNDKISENLSSVVIHYIEQAKHQGILDDYFIKNCILKKLAEVFPTFNIFLRSTDYELRVKSLIAEHERDPWSDQCELFAYFSNHYGLALSNQIKLDVIHEFSKHKDDIRWLERTGVYVCCNLRILTSDLASIFTSMLFEAGGGWQRIYADNVFNKAILPLLEVIDIRKNNDISLPDLIEMNIDFTNALLHHRVHMTIKPVHITTALRYFESTVHDTNEDNKTKLVEYFTILRKQEFKIIRCDEEFLVVYPANDFVYPFKIGNIIL